LLFKIYSVEIFNTFENVKLKSSPMNLKKVLCFQILIIISLNLKAQYNPFFQTYSAAGDVAVASIDLVSDSGYILNASDGGDKWW
jgi:hypothetical protein